MLDPLIIIILLAGLIYGTWKGLVTFLNHILLIVCLIFSFLIAFFLFKPIATKLTALFLNQDISEIIVFDVIFVAFFFPGYKVNKLLKDKWLKDKIQSDGLQKILGGFTGLLAASIAIWLMLVLFISVQPLSDKKINVFRGSGMARSMIYGSGSLQKIMPSGIRKNFKTNYRKIIYTD